MIRIAAGAAHRDVTPSFPVPLGGYGQRTTPSEGVLDPVGVTALVLGDDSPVVIVTADVISTAGPVKSEVVERLSRHEWFDPGHLVVTATHTHSGPVPHDPSGTSDATAKFSEMLVAGIVAAVEEAHTSRREAIVVSRTGNVRIGFNRWRPDDDSMVDSRIPVVAVIDANSQDTIAVLFGAGCHPTTFGWNNMKISADYPGAAKRRVQETLPGVIAMFVNTTEGDVVPLTSERRDALDPRGYTGDDPSCADHIGQLLADEVLRTLSDISTNPGASDGTLKLVSMEIDAAANNAGLDEETARVRLAESTAVLRSRLGDDFSERVPMAHLWAASSAAVVEADMGDDDMRDVMIACCYYLGLTARLARGSNPAPVQAPVQAMVLDHAHILFMPGEVLVGVGELWSNLVGRPESFTVGLANTHLRYLPLASHFAEPGADRRYETVTAGLAPGEVDRLVSLGAQQLLSASGV